VVLEIFSIQATLNCDMNFRAYPFDSQKCQIRLIPCKQNVLFENLNMSDFQIRTFVSPDVGNVTGEGFHRVNLRWEKGFPALTVRPGIPYPEMVLESAQALSCQEYKRFADCIKISCVFQRRMGYYVVQYFLPTFAFVLMSWITFWLENTMASLKLSVSLW